MRITLIMLIVIVALIGVSLFPVRETDHPQFASPAFQRVWQTHSAVAAQPLDLWGSEPLLWRVEPYLGSYDNRRTVQYFERGRMEIERNSDEVTFGRLAQELTTGRIELGATFFEERTPAQISIDGGSEDDRIPTYLSLGKIVGKPAPDYSRSGNRVTDWIDRSGLISSPVSPAVVRFGSYVAETGHNLPDVTTELLSRSEFAEGRWLETLGYPISEPVWTYVRRGEHVKASLVQVFERRVLIYTPNLEEERRFTIANSGRHYYQWRYGAQLTAEPQPVNVDNEATGVSVPAGYQARVYGDGVGTPLDMAIGPTGHLLVLTMDGRILKAASIDPSGRSSGFSVWADGIDGPIDLSVVDSTVHVRTDSGVIAFIETNGVGVGAFGGGTMTMSSPGTPGRLIVNPRGARYLLIDQGEKLLQDLESGQSVTEFADHLSSIGPVIFVDDDLYAAGQSLDNRSILVQNSPSATTNDYVQQHAAFVFPGGTVVHGLEAGDRSDWPMLDPGSIVVAAESDERGSIFFLARHTASGANELVEFATGFRRPVALVFGLDGSLFVADAERGQIIRILHTN